MSTTAFKDQEMDMGSVSRPACDILETADELLLLADMPGVKSDDVDVRFENGELTIHGRRSNIRSDRRAILSEYEATHTHRTFRVTQDVAAERIHAELKNGLLTVHIPKAESAKPRKIAVKGE
jgi:HSP20 family protein